METQELRVSEDLQDNKEPKETRLVLCVCLCVCACVCTVYACVLSVLYVSGGECRGVARTGWEGRRAW